MRFAFVLEQTLGHGAHSRNLRRALDAEPWIQPEVFELRYEDASAALRFFPNLANWSIRASLAARRSLSRAQRRAPLDAIFIHTQVASLLSIGLMKRVPTIVSLDATPRNLDLVGSGYGHRTNGRQVEALKANVNRRAMLAATALVTWNRWAAESLVSDYGVPASRIHVIAPGVDLDLFRPNPGPRAPGPVRVLFVGGDFVRKGGVDLLDAMGAVPNAEIDIVTGGADVPARPGVVCRVHRGLAPQSAQLLELYRSADIFALPSHSDCLPQVLAEAAASGLPIVCTRSGAMPEVVHDGENGLLVADRSPRELAGALRRLAGDPELRRRFGKAGRALAEGEHDAARNNRRIFGLMASAGRRVAVPSLLAGVSVDRS